MNLSKLIPWIVTLFIFAAILLTGLVNIAGTGLFVLKAEKVMGTVSVIPGNKPSLVYADRFGNSHITPFRHILSGTLSDRQSISILYNPNNPDDMTVNSFVYLWAVGLMTMVIGAIGVIFAAANIDWQIIWVALGGKPSPKAATQQSQQRQAATNEAAAPDEISKRQAATINLSPELMKNAFGPLKPLIDDKGVTDIILASPSAIFVKKNNQVVKTDISLPTDRQYELLIDRMLTMADNSYSISKPIVDGMVTPLVRINAIHKVLCEEGPYVTLRVSRFTSVKFADLLKSTIAPRELLAYLRAMFVSGHTVLVAGEVGTGKTTLIRALASTIPTHESILVIEDTPEIKIEHPAVRYVRTRLSNIEGAGKVSPGECIKAGMRMAMNRIIFGEIRDPEAAESFIDACVSGHPGMSTIHARSAHDAFSRLELLLSRQQVGVERSALEQQIGSAVQVIVYAKVCKETGERRISEVIEVMPSEVDRTAKMQPIFTYTASGKMPVWKVCTKQSFYADELRDFEGGAVNLGMYPDWLKLQS